jgi:predicted CopG family antitoxin
MSVKTVSLRIEAYQRLRAARRYPGESFSQVIMRARWPDETMTADRLLGRYGTMGPTFTDEELERIEAADRSDVPPVDKWSTP